MKKRNNIWISPLIMMGVLFMLISSCEKEDDNNTALLLPALKTSIISDFTKTTAKCGAFITSDGGSKLTARGICWSTDTTPGIADAIFSDPYYSLGTGYYNCIITGLTANTTYYVRAYATNSKGTGYGNQQHFTTLPEPTYGSVSDIDGNIYKTVQIGTRVWMAENLRTTKYNNGTAIPLVTGDTAWVALTTPAYCWYNNDAVTYKTPYGALYNGYALDMTINGGKNVCPANWHVSTDEEWEVWQLI